MQDQATAHRLVVVLDIQGSGQRTAYQQKHLRKVLFDVLGASVRAVGRQWSQLDVVDRGDGLRLLFAEPYDVLHPLVLEVSGRLREEALMSKPEFRPQWRMAVDLGPLVGDGNGWTGNALVHAARLVDAAAVKEKLGDAMLALVLSEVAYDMLVRPGGRPLAAESFEKVTVAVKETTATSWVRLFGRPADSAAVRDETAWVARAGADELASAMGTAEWQAVRGRIAAVVGLADRMDRDHDRIAALPIAERDEYRARQFDAWCVRFSDLLEERPELVARLRSALSLGPAVSQTAGNRSPIINSGRDTVYGGRDVYHNSPGSTAITSAAGVGLGAGTALFGSKAAGAGAAAGATNTAAASSGVIATTKTALVVGALAASTAAAGSGYAAYQHYTCGPVFGDRPAVEVVNAAAERIKDESFRFSYRAGTVVQAAGEVDNRQPVATYHATFLGETIDVVLDHNTVYYRLSGEPWQIETGQNEPPPISQGNPIVAADYLAAAEGTTKDHCSIHGSLDASSLVPDTGDSSTSTVLTEPVPFDASISPDGRLTRLRITMPTEPSEWEWQIYDYGAAITVTPPTVS